MRKAPGPLEQAGVVGCTPVSFCYEEAVSYAKRFARQRRFILLVISLHRPRMGLPVVGFVGLETIKGRFAPKRLPLHSQQLPLYKAA